MGQVVLVDIAGPTALLLVIKLLFADDCAPTLATKACDFQYNPLISVVPLSEESSKPSLLIGYPSLALRSRWGMVDFSGAAFAGFGWARAMCRLQGLRLDSLASASQWDGDELAFFGNGVSLFGGNFWVGVLMAED